MTSGHRKKAGLRLGAGVVVGLMALSGCGGGSTTDQLPALTVTTTPTVTVTLARPAPPVAATTGNPKSDDVGRRFDLGTIVGVQDVGQVPVIIFNRWSRL